MTRVGGLEGGLVGGLKGDLIDSLIDSLIEKKTKKTRSTESQIIRLSTFIYYHRTSDNVNHGEQTITQGK